LYQWCNPEENDGTIVCINPTLSNFSTALIHIKRNCGLSATHNEAQTTADCRMFEATSPVTQLQIGWNIQIVVKSTVNETCDLVCCRESSKWSEKFSKCETFLFFCLSIYMYIFLPKYGKAGVTSLRTCEWLSKDGSANEGFIQRLHCILRQVKKNNKQTTITTLHMGVGVKVFNDRYQ